MEGCTAVAGICRVRAVPPCCLTQSPPSARNNLLSHKLFTKTHRLSGPCKHHSRSTMSTVSTQAHTEKSRRRNRGGRRNYRNVGQRAPQAAPTNTNTAEVPSPARDEPRVEVPQASTEDVDICFICAEPVKFYSLSECNHRTCHICALRLRALYKVRA